MSEKKPKKPNKKPQYAVLYFNGIYHEIITVRHIDDVLKLVYQHKRPALIQPMTYETIRAIERDTTINPDEIDFEVWLDWDVDLS